MNWEDRLRDTFSNEQAAMDARPRPADRMAPGPLHTERTWLSPRLLLAGFGLLCLVVLGAGAFLQNDEPTEIVAATADDEPVSSTATAVVKPTAPPTSVPVDATATPASQDATSLVVTPVPAVTAIPTTAPPKGCPVPFGTARVVDVAPDDPDGGLVVHSDAGVDAPVVGVLRFDEVNLSVTPGCAIVPNGARWLEVYRSEAGVEPLQGWVNSRYLAEDTTDAGKTGASYQIFFPLQQPVTEADGNLTWAAPVERPVGNADGRPTADEAIELLFAGPTEAEIAAGLSGLGNPGIHPPSEADCARPAEVTMPEDGIVVVQLCVEIMRAGIGDDARSKEAITSTVALVTGRENIIVLEPDGRCFGDLSDIGEGCLHVLDDDEDPAWCERGGELSSRSTVLEHPGRFDAELANHVVSIDAVDTESCTLVIIELDEIGADGRALVDGAVMPPSVAAEVIPRFGIRVEFEGPIDPGLGPAPTADWNTGAAALTFFDDGLGVWIGADQVDGARLSFLSDPPRVIVAIPHDSPNKVSAAVTKLDGYYLFPIIQAEPGVPVLFGGIGAAFEAAGLALIRGSDGIVEQRFATGNPGVAYKEFGLDIGLAPGDYELALVACDQCDDELTWIPFSVQ